MELALPPDAQTYMDLLSNITAEDIRYEYLNDSTKRYFRHTASTVVYMSVCLGCTIWQLMAAAELVYKARKWLHFAVLFETILSFLVISCSILNPLTDVTCELVSRLAFHREYLVNMYISDSGYRLYQSTLVDVAFKLSCCTKPTSATTVLNGLLLLAL